MKKVVIIGAGAAGMLCGIIAARKNHQVWILEKNEKPGKKLYITGKGRCNLTNCCEKTEFFQQVMRNPKFLYSSFSSFSNYDTMDFFESLGLPLKVERGGRVFPESDKSSDVIKVLEKELERLHVKISYHTEVAKVIKKDNILYGVMIKGEKKPLLADALVIATGGLSYASTGSTGDGYSFARALGHTVTPLCQSLVPFQTREAIGSTLSGLSLKNIRISIFSKEKLLYEAFGEMLFTHFGVSGPLILSASSLIGEELKTGPLELKIDLKPALTEELLDARIVRDFKEIPNKQLKHALDKLLPKAMVPVLLSMCKIKEDKPVHQVTKEERQLLGERIKKFPLTITSLRGYQEAVITKGGVCVKEINPKTMESKLVKGVYFIGEVLDVDALTGGYNLQIAWSTAYAAGNNI